MKANKRKVLLVVLALIFAAGMARVLWQLHDYRVAARAYDRAEELVMQRTESPSLPSAVDKTPNAGEFSETGEDTSVEELQEPLGEDAQFLTQLNLDTLRETNEDVLGWIYIPDSEISYPLIRAADNQEYLRRAWDGTYNQVGCIFLECRNHSDFSDFNTIIYGHYMNDGTMFGSLHNYKDQEYWNTHPYIYIVTDEGVRRYQVFSAYEAGITQDTYRLYFENDARKQSVLDFYMDSSIRVGELIPETDDRILTLSTCTEFSAVQTRWVVQAVLTGEFLTE